MFERFKKQVEKNGQLAVATMTLVAAAYLGMPTEPIAKEVQSRSVEPAQVQQVEGMVNIIYGETERNGRERKIAIVSKFDEFGTLQESVQLNTAGNGELIKNLENMRGQMVSVDVVNGAAVEAKYAIGARSTVVQAGLPETMKFGYVYCKFADSPPIPEFPTEHKLLKDYWNKQFNSTTRVVDGVTYGPVTLDLPWSSYLDANSFPLLHDIAMGCVAKVPNLDPLVTQVGLILDERTSGSAWGGPDYLVENGKARKVGFAWFPWGESKKRWIPYNIVHEFLHGMGKNGIGHSGSHNSGTSYDNLFSPHGSTYANGHLDPHPTWYAKPQNLNGPVKIELGVANVIDVGNGQIKAGQLASHDVVVASLPDGSQVTMEYRDHLADPRVQMSGFVIHTVNQSRQNKDWVWTGGTRKGVDSANVFAGSSQLTIEGMTMCFDQNRSYRVAKNVPGFRCSQNLYLPLINR